LTVEAAEQRSVEQTYWVTGMDCASCAQSIETAVAQLDGAAHVELHFTTEKLIVQGVVAPETVIGRVRDMGYDVREPDADRTAAPTPTANNFWQFMWQRWHTRLALLGVLLILPGVIFSELGGREHWLLSLLSVAAMVVAGVPIAQNAWRALRFSREITMNLLMSVAAVGAVIIGAYTEAGMVIVLFALGEALEGYTADRARNSIRSLMNVVPDEAIVLRPCMDCREHLGQSGYSGGACPFCGIEEQRVPVRDLVIGDRIVVRPGERIPMDGRILEGHSSVNQAPITGESMPVPKEPGAAVFASSINGEGALEIGVTHLAKNNTISRLIQMVEEAQARKAPAQRFVDRFARWYTPAVMALALLVAVVPPLLFGQPFLNPDSETFGWLYRGLALLVVACPCALVISTPVSIVSGISRAARQGILFKGGAHLEALTNIQAVAFDKTGTLTQGEPILINLRAEACAADLNGGAHDPRECVDERELLALAAAVERRSEHPLGKAILHEARQLGVAERYPAAANVQALAGRGVQGVVDGRLVTIGSHTHFEMEFPHSQPHCAEAEKDAAAGRTPVMVAVDAVYQGTIVVADTLRADSQAAVSALRQAGIAHVVMLTGDNQATAEAVAAAAGLTDVRAGLMPGDKVAAVQALQAEFGTVAMVGDGINDAPALATADVGVAIGGAGSSGQAMETADVTLMQDSLRPLAFALRLSRATMRTIYVNVVLSIGIKLLFLILVLFGLGTMWMAVLADMGTSLLVTLNGMRLLRWGK
jgi:Cd2+/Zn2+-exporting ATPase